MSYPKAPETPDYILDRVEYDTNAGCWLWSRGLDTRGYGQARWKGRGRGAHRVSYQIFRGSISEGLFVCHRCDVPCCVNPDHLFLGTPADNVRDMLAKGRNVVLAGEDAPWAKADLALVKDIVGLLRADTRHAEIARSLGCPISVVTHIAAGNTWVGVTGGRISNPTRGERVGNSKLTEDRVRQIRSERAAGATFDDLQNRNPDIAGPTIRGVVYRQRWKHVA